MSIYTTQEFYERWRHESISFQIGNIGSEVYRSLKYYDNNQKRFKNSYRAALELFDITIKSAIANNDTNTEREICRAREEFCDYFNGNSLHTDPVKMQNYYDQFAMMRA